MQNSINTPCKIFENLFFSLFELFEIFEIFKFSQFLSKMWIWLSVEPRIWNFWDFLRKIYFFENFEIQKNFAGHQKISNISNFSKNKEFLENLGISQKSTMIEKIAKNFSKNIGKFKKFKKCKMSINTPCKIIFLKFWNFEIFIFTKFLFFHFFHFWNFFQFFYFLNLKLRSA